MKYEKLKSRRLSWLNPICRRRIAVDKPMVNI